jgi:hypothetical protein
VKKILSANAESSLNIECIHEDTDVRGNIVREELEEWMAPLLAQVQALLTRALEGSGGWRHEVGVVAWLKGSHISGACAVGGWGVSGGAAAHESCRAVLECRSLPPHKANVWSVIVQEHTKWGLSVVFVARYK